MRDEPMALAAGFPPADMDAWQAAVDKVLRGRPFDAVLRTDLGDGIVTEPLYTALDATTGAAASRAALAAAAGARPDPPRWDIRQRHRLTSPEPTNRSILRDLARGVTSIELDAAGLDDTETLAAALDGMLLDLAPIALAGASADVATARMVLDLMSRRGLDGATIRADLGCDPIGRVATEGRPPTAGTIDDAVAETAALAAGVASTHPLVRCVRASGVPFAEAGASAAIELAATLASTVHYARALDEHGLGVTDALGQILVTLTVGTDQFLDIAKLRAWRTLWSRMAEVSGAPDKVGPVQAVTSVSVLSRRDPWVNMLRTTTGCVAAAVGGADIITVLPFDVLCGVPDELGRRMARNTQLVVMDESNVHRVVDPAGGSWYVEQLTDQLARAAWSEFTAIERAGGIMAELGSGALQTRIAERWDTQRRAVATRRRPITGVSEFPDLDEAALDREPRRCSRADGAGTVIEPLPVRRLAGDFERLRDLADAATAPPTVFLANLGPVAEHGTRAGWAANLFATGGIRAVDAGGFDDVAALGGAFRDSGCALAVICSSDAVYAERAADAAATLRAAGARRIYLAGRPGDHRAEYEAAGIDHFVHVGVDVVDVLESALVAAGVDLEGAA